MNAYIETWLGKNNGANAVAGFSFNDYQVLFVAGLDGFVRSLVIGPPTWVWAWGDPITQSHHGIAGITAYFHPGDNRGHCFVALRDGNIWESGFTDVSKPALQGEIWLGNLAVGAVAITGLSMPNAAQLLFIAGQDGLVYPLEIGASTNWVWSWGNPIASVHDNITGVAAYYHPFDNAYHVFITLQTGDIWEARQLADGQWLETFIGVLDGGEIAIAGQSALSGCQHVYAAGIAGIVYPLQIGPPHWKWRWDNQVTNSREGIAGVAAYFHALDNREHIITALQSGDIWESRFELPTNVAVNEWNPAEFPISYWLGPPPDFVDKTAAYQQVARGGFTFALEGNWALEPANNLAIFRSAAASNLRVFISDPRIASLVGNSTTLDDGAKQTLDQVIADYSVHSALAGYFLADEPGVDRFPILGEIIDYFRNNDPGHACYINILPIHAGANGPYIDNYLNIVKPFVLSFDHYSLLSNGTDEQTYFENLHVVRDKSIAHGIPFWQFILATQHGGYRLPTAAELRYEAMQLLAFGGKAVLYFTYWTYEGLGEAIVNDDGSPTSRFNDIISINSDLQSLGKYLLGAQSALVFENGAVPVGGQAPPSNASVRILSNANITVGEFLITPAPIPIIETGADIYVLLASRDYNNTTSIDARFSSQGLSMFDKVNDNWIQLDPSNPIPIILAPGDAALFLLTSLIPAFWGN